MKHGSLFSGIGGFDYAAEQMGWENLFHCEWNEFGQQVLKHYWPQAKSYNDITKSDFTIWRGKIDIITGGFPCQPYSQAGKRLGKEDDRHLWPQMLRVIREVQPRWVVGENVLGLVNWDGGLVFDEVQADLEAQGYEVQPYVLPAAAVNAPHRRDRVWFVAYANKWRWREGYKCKHNNQGEWKICENEQNNRNKIWSNSWDGGLHRAVTYAESDGSHRTSNEASGKIGRQDGYEAEQSAICGEIWDASNTNGNRINQSREGRQSEQLNEDGFAEATIMHADSTSKQGEYIRQKRKGKSDRPNCRYGFNQFKDFPTQSPICGGNDGLPTELDGITFPKWRNESIKAYGNAIVPQVALQIFRAIQQYEDTTRIK